MNPTDYHFFEGDIMPKIINIQRRFKKGLIRTADGKTHHVTLQDWLLDGIMLQDYVEVKKDHVTDELIVTNYFINVEVAQEIEESYKEECL